MKFLLVIFAIAVLCTPGILGCTDQYAEAFGNCMIQFSQLMTSSGGSMEGEDAMMNLMCSKEGQSAFGCLIGVMNDCPDLFSSMGAEGTNPLDALKGIPGFDSEAFFKEGGIEGACAMMTGPCSQVQQCFATPSPPPSMAKRGVDSTQFTNNNYLMFLLQSKELCGDKNEQMKCMLEKLEACPESVRSQVEAQFENAIKMAMPQATGIVTFKDTRDFMQKECDFLREDKIQSQESCAQGVFLDDKFAECNTNVSNVYKASKNCMVYSMNQQCIASHMNETCSEDAANFFIRNSHFIWPGTPRDCATYDPTAASAMVTMSMGVVLMSLIVSMF